MNHRASLVSNNESTMRSPVIDKLFSLFPELSKVHNPVLVDILNAAQQPQISCGSQLVGESCSCNNLVLLLSGEIRIFQSTKDGREITLYRVGQGNICPLSLSRLMSNTEINASTLVESEVDALVLNREQFEQCMEVSSEFRHIVLTNMAASFGEIMNAFYDTAFERLDMRMACLLGRLFEREQSDTITITHQEIAQELGTTREVASRILKQMEHEGCIILSRGHIQIDPSKKFPQSK